ncbi:MAG: TonB-dependent receptor [Sideroxydans sp.]|nr:TonB-dependent receptor [Sideroxydans sp.]
MRKDIPGVAIAEFSRVNFLIPLVGLALCMALPARAAAEPAAQDDRADLTALSIEELLAVEVSSASKFPQKTVDAPAAVTIITAADIKTYGYRTLADLLKSVRGMNISYDRNYDYLGVRGSGRTWDINSRVLLLVDGNRLNDNVFDQAAIGTEFPLDMDLIARVEIVRGPGSSIYGSNAVLGVVNVITKNGGELNGMEVSGELASFDTSKGRLSYGKRYANDAELLLSASKYRSTGQDLFFPEFNFPSSNNGVAAGMDGDRYQNFFGKLSNAGITLTGGYSSRDKAVPTASYSSTFNDPAMRTNDGYAFADIAYSGAVSANWDIAAHLFQGRYSYEGIYPAAGVLNKDTAQGDWRGGEAKFLGRFGQHKAVAGLEYQSNSRQDQRNYDIAPYTSYVDDTRSSKREGVYVQDEVTLGEGLLLNAGLRHDNYSSVGGTTNPRLGLIWSSAQNTALKFLYGTAFRPPNVYELYYASGGSQKGNPGLVPEKIATSEIVVEHSPRQNLRFTADAYRSKTSDSINQIIDPADGLLVFVNEGQVDARGVEFEAEHLRDDGVRLRTSYAWQISRDQSGTELVNSPRHLVKLNGSMPVRDKLRGGLELQYTGSRKTLAGGAAGGHWLANLTLLGEKLAKNLELSASIYNLFDTRYSDPGGQEHAQDLIAQDGRNYRLKLSYHF